MTDFFPRIRLRKRISINETLLVNLIHANTTLRKGHRLHNSKFVEKHSVCLINDKIHLQRHIIIQTVH